MLINRALTNDPQLSKQMTRRTVEALVGAGDAGRHPAFNQVHMHMAKEAASGGLTRFTRYDSPVLAKLTTEGQYAYKFKNAVLLRSTRPRNTSVTDIIRAKAGHELLGDFAWTTTMMRTLFGTWGNWTWKQGKAADRAEAERINQDYLQSMDKLIEISMLLDPVKLHEMVMDIWRTIQENLNSGVRFYDTMMQRLPTILTDSTQEFKGLTRLEGYCLYYNFGHCDKNMKCKKLHSCINCKWDGHPAKTCHKLTSGEKPKSTRPSRKPAAKKPSHKKSFDTKRGKGRRGRKPKSGN